MVGVAPPARPAPPAEVRELGAAGRAVARRCEDRAEGHRRGRGQRLEGVSAHASPHWRKPPKTGETRPCAHDWEARTSGQGVVWVPPVGPSCVHEAPFVAELHERHSTAVLARSNGAPPSMSATTWSTVRSRVGWAGCRDHRPGTRSRAGRRGGRSSAWTGGSIADPRGRDGWHRCPTGAACSLQRLPARLVTTPQTVHSFTRESSMGWLVRSIRSGCYAYGARLGRVEAPTARRSRGDVRLPAGEVRLSGGQHGAFEWRRRLQDASQEVHAMPFVVKEGEDVSGVRRRSPGRARSSSGTPTSSGRSEAARRTRSRAT